MMRLILYLIIFVEASSFVKEEVCLTCKCFFVSELPNLKNNEGSSQIITFTFTNDSVELFNVNTTYGALQKYLYVDCFNKADNEQVTDISWPELNILGILANFQSNKWKKIDNFPISIKNQISVLSVANNLICEVEEFELNNFNSLKMLNLSNNHIEVIKKRTFSKLNLLKILDLSANSITGIEDWAFFGTDLQFLNVSKNYLTHLTLDMFRGLNNLTVLDLSENKLEKILDFGSILPSLEMLSIRSNELYKLGELPHKLKNLNAGLNKLVELRLVHAQLEILNIEFNNLSSFEETNFSRLKVLRASHNSLTKLSDLRAHEVIVLDLSYNKFKEIPQEVNSEIFPFLEELYLDGNPMSNIKFPTQNISFSHLRMVSFTNLKSLKKIAKNTFSGVFPDSIQSCSNNDSGVHLNFSHNSLKYVDKDAFHNIQLCSVDFNHNNLKTFPESLLPWRNMSYINFQNNPWQCDCNIQWMLDEFLVFMYRNHPKLLLNLRCSTPLRYNNKLFVYWYNRSENVFCNSGPSSFYLDLAGGKKVEVWTISVIACVILGCFILIITIIILILICTKPVPYKKKQIRSIKKTGPPYYKQIKTSESKNGEEYVEKYV